jgi:uncharacterized membrane protein YcgQ (UPF0703/DUF1980 family)
MFGLVQFGDDLLIIFGLVQFGYALLILFGLMQFGDDLDNVRTTYLALNSQLVSELPLLIQVNVTLYKNYSLLFSTFRLVIIVIRYMPGTGFT